MKRYLVRNTFNGSYLMGSENDHHFDPEKRYWTGNREKAKLFEDKELAQDIADSMNFGSIEEVIDFREIRPVGKKINKEMKDV